MPVGVRRERGGNARYFHQYPAQGGQRASHGQVVEIFGWESTAIRIQEISNPGGPSTLVNQTLPSHPFHMGDVARTPEQRGTSVYMVTEGRGINTGPLTALINQIAGPIMFNRIDDQLRNHVNGP